MRYMIALSRIRMSSQVVLSERTDLNHAGGSLGLLCMPRQTISRINSPYLSIISGKSFVISPSLTIILSRSSFSISRRRGRMRNQVRTVIGFMTIQSPGSFPLGIESRLVNSNGILIGCSVTVSDSCWNKFFILIISSRSLSRCTSGKYRRLFATNH